MVTNHASASAGYDEAFRLFLQSTDQKTEAAAWLKKFVGSLSNKRLFVDVGAGTGELTATLVPFFAESIAFEPNPTLRQRLQKNCPTTQVREETLQTMNLEGSPDFILCSHVLYLVKPDLWAETLVKLATHLQPGGKLVAIAQSPDTDCKRFTSPYSESKPNLRDTALPDTLAVRVETIASHISVKDMARAKQIATFLLSGSSTQRLPSDEEVEKYFQTNFRQADGSFRLSCHQDLMVIG